MSIKLIAVDVDGTLVSDDHLTISEKNIEGLKKAHSAGIKVVISTGRTLSLTEKEMIKLDCVDYLLLSNGAVVIDVKTKNIIFNNYIEQEKVEKIIEIFEKYPMVYEIYAGNNGYVNEYSYNHYFETPELPKKFMEEYRGRMKRIKDVKELIALKNVEKFNVNYVASPYNEEIKSQLDKISDLTYSAGFEGNIEVVNKDVDKGNTLAWLAEKLEVNAAEVMVFGDSGNDKTMLEWSECSYAMKNANATAKKAAQFITEKDNNEGGIGFTVLEYLTNNKK